MVTTMKILNCILTNTDIEYPEVGTKYGFGKPDTMFTQE